MPGQHISMWNLLAIEPGEKFRGVGPPELLIPIKPADVLVVLALIETQQVLQKNARRRQAVPALQG